MQSGKEVSKAVGIFRSKVKRFLRKFKNQVSQDERAFWEDRLNNTYSAVKAFKTKAKNSESQGVKMDIFKDETVGEIEVEADIPPPYSDVLFFMSIYTDDQVS